MHRSRTFGSLLLGLAVVLSGCAVGNRYAYSEARATPHLSGTGPVAVAAQDQRPYVVSGDKNPDFVGLQRNRFGIPFDVKTDKGQPLASDFAGTIVKSLAGAGYQATAYSVASRDKADAVKARLLQNKPRRALLLTIKEWKTDTKKNVALYYDLTLSVTSAEGKPMAQKTLQGRDDLGGAFFNTSKYANLAAPDAFGLKVQELLDAPEIARSLK
jgi:hypothetical protein